MRFNRFFQNIRLALNQIIQLDQNATNHITNVLQLPINDKIIVFNGQGGEFLCSIKNVSKKTVEVLVEKYQEINNESPLKIHLMQGISRGEKMDLVIQKTVELGVNEITPIITERCGVQLSNDRWQKKFEHWNKIIISACEQCGRNIIPILHPVTQLKDSAENIQSQTKLMLHPFKSQQLSTLEPSKEATVLIGPEGGFSEKETELAKQNGFQSIQLGPRILRTETAGIACISALQTLWGDF